MKQIYQVPKTGKMSVADVPAPALFPGAVLVRGTKSKNDYANNDLFNTPNGSAGWQQHLTAYLFAAGHLWTVSPSTLLQVSYGFARQTNYQIGNSFLKFDATKYGFSSNLASEQQVVGLPNIGISGLVTDGGNGAVTKNGSGTLTLSGVNDYTGTTTISAGTLSLGTTGTLASSVIAVNSAASGRAR